MRVCITTSLSIHPLQDTGYFPILAIINKAAVNMEEQVSFQVYALFPLDISLKGDC